MRLRLLAFVPPAALISGVLLMSASSLVSALESTFIPPVSSTFSIERFESRCEQLDREIAVLSRGATACDQDLQCLYSPIVCPIAMDPEAERNYQALQAERSDHCGESVSPSPSPSAPESGSRQGMLSRSSSHNPWVPTLVDASACRTSASEPEQVFEPVPAAGSTEPPVFVF